MNELNLNPTLSPSPKATAVAGGANGLAASPSDAQAKFAQAIKAEQAKVAKQAAQQEGAVAESNMQEAVARIQEYVQHSERKLDFRMDESSGQTIIRVYDKQSDELIRQIPGELALKLAEHLNDEEPSLLFRAQV